MIHILLVAARIGVATVLLLIVLGALHSIIQDIRNLK